MFTSQTKTPPTTPASGSAVEIKDQLVVATNKFADPLGGSQTAAAITTTAVNIANTQGTGTATFGDVYIDSVSTEASGYTHQHQLHIPIRILIT